MASLPIAKHGVAGLATHLGPCGVDVFMLVPVMLHTKFQAAM